MAGLGTPMALRVAVTLGLPDRLRGGVAQADELAAELDVAPVALDLLLGHLVTVGILEAGDDGYRTTAYGAHLCADAGNGLHDLLHLDAAGGRAELAFVAARRRIEPVGGRGARTEADLAMLVIFGGRERRGGEFRTLAAVHGLVLDAVTDLTDERSLLEFRLGRADQWSSRSR
jgi:hypothetical protein